MTHRDFRENLYKNTCSCQLKEPRPKTPRNLQSFGEYSVSDHFLLEIPLVGIYPRSSPISNTNRVGSGIKRDSNSGSGGKSQRHGNIALIMMISNVQKDNLFILENPRNSTTCSSICWVDLVIRDGGCGSMYAQLPIDIAFGSINLSTDAYIALTCGRSHH